MSRPVGITASAVVAVVGSMIVLLFAVLLIVTPSITIGQPPPPYAAQIGIVAGAIAAALAGLGIWTAVDLFRLRPWARMSILIFAGFLGAWAALALIVTMVMPLPTELTAGTGQIFRTSMAVGFGTPLAIAVWWLIQFNAKSTKAAFASPVPEAASPRPLSVSIIGWTGIVGGLGCLIWIPIRLPAFLFGMTFNGWTAGIVYGLFGALWLYIGKGLLDLRERARLLAIGWFVFGLVHTCVITLVPSVRERMFEMQRTINPNQQYPTPIDQGALMYLMIAFTAILAATAIWFLVRNRAAFVRAGS
jgi:hypothetical protein